MTGWSSRGLGFRGVPLREVVASLKPQPRGDWASLFQHSADGYDVGVYREDAMDTVGLPWGSNSMICWGFRV